MGSDRQSTVVLGIAVAVVAVWVLATLVATIDPHREVSPALNGIAATVVSALLAGTVASSHVRRRNGRKNGDDDE